jgi:ATP-dependent DNA helicase DinG
VALFLFTPSGCPRRGDRQIQLHPARVIPSVRVVIGLSNETASPPCRVRELTAGIFADGGWLMAGANLEHRPEQERIARAIAAAYHDDRALLCEAGTGVGKSLAYLLPGLIRAQQQKRQLIVSTHTISLQEQVDTKDLPLCRKILAGTPELREFAAFRSTVLVGKANYLCTTRLAQALRGQGELFATAEQEELKRVAAWAGSTKEGLRHELNPPPLPEVWETVNADSAACSRKNCDGSCHYQRAKARLRDAHVVIVNHSLLFALLALGGERRGEGGARGVLFPDDFVVIDEAHTLPEIATAHFGLSVSSYGLDRLLKSLYHPKKRRGLLQRHGAESDRLIVEDALEASAQFFGFLADKYLEKKPLVRVREKGVAEPWLDEPLLKLVAALGRLATAKEDTPAGDELAQATGRVKAYRGSITSFLRLALEEHVYWLERGGKAGRIVTLRSAPLDVAPRLRETLFGSGTGVILTSATLAMGGAIEPFQRRVGAEDERALVEKSPFDFARQMRVYVAADVAAPGGSESRLDLAGLVDYLRFCTLKVKGGSLVLFTSYLDMKNAAAALAADYAAAGRPLLVQGEGASRTELTRMLRQAGNGVLFGTDSFWTGVDVPGRALSQVVITRLPFDPPTHPIAEARAEWVEAKGGNAFAEIMLPEALIKFRQGAGRLIRSHADHGVVTILDPRVLTKTYGREFIAALPRPEFERMTRADREEIFRPFP